MGIKRIFVLVGVISLIVGLVGGFVGGYYFKDFKAAEPDPSTAGDDSYFTQIDPERVVINPEAKTKLQFSEVVPRGTYKDIFTCPTDPGWTSVMPGFIWNGKDLGKIFPKYVNTADPVVRKKILTKYYNFSGPLVKVPTSTKLLNDIAWFGAKYVWEIEASSFEPGGEIRLYEAVNVVHQSLGRKVSYIYKPKPKTKGLTEYDEWYKESDLLGDTDFVESHPNKLDRIVLCIKNGSSGE